MEYYRMFGVSGQIGGQENTLFWMGMYPDRLENASTGLGSFILTAQKLRLLLPMVYSMVL